MPTLLRQKPNKGRQGFTLAELLIALAILGLIATFAIPKLLASQQDTKRRAIMQEAISALSAATANIVAEGSYGGATDNWHLYQTHLNATQEIYLGVANVGNGFVLANGATLTGFNNSPYLGNETVLISWNGSSVIVVTCTKLTKVVCPGGVLFETDALPGKVSYHNDAVNKAAFLDIFGQT